VHSEARMSIKMVADAIEESNSFAEAVAILQKKSNCTREEATATIDSWCLLLAIAEAANAINN
jgi:hypothetical protein